MLNQASDKDDPIIQIFCIFQKCNLYSHTMSRRNFCSVSSGKGMCGVPCQVEQKVAKRQTLCTDSSLEQETQAECFYYLPSTICQLIQRVFALKGTMEIIHLPNYGVTCHQDSRLWKSQLSCIISIQNRAKFWQQIHGHPKVSFMPKLTTDSSLSDSLFFIAENFSH